MTTRRQLLALGAGTGAALSSRLLAAPRDAAPWTGGGDIAVGSGKLHYATMGKGPPLVLLPKLGGWIADWRLAAPYLAQTHTVIAFDPPGHGGSVMNGPPPYIMTVPECAAALLAALDEIGVERSAVAGNSLGGVIGIVMAACWPGRVEKLAILSTSLIGAMDRAAIRAQDAGRADATSTLPAAERNRLFGTLDPRVNEEHERSSAIAGGWLRACERGVGRVVVTDYLPRIVAPTLLLNADRGRYAKYAEVGLRLIPHARAAVIADAGSFVHQEKPRETAAAITAFLDG